MMAGQVCVLYSSVVWGGWYRSGGWWLEWCGVGSGSNIGMVGGSGYTNHAVIHSYIMHC